MKKIYVLLLIAASVAPAAFAQNLQWARKMGGTGTDMGQAIAVDNLGNVYSTGVFMNTVDFDPGPGVFNLTAAGSWDIYVAKLDSAGIFQWAIRIGSTGDDRGHSIATDGAAVYLTGMFSLTVDFDPGSGIFNMTSAGGYDEFALKLNAAGNFMWANRLGGAADDRGNGIALDAASNVHITGYFNGNVNGITNLNAAGQWDAFVMKLTSAGNLLWSKKMGSTGQDEGNGITVSSTGNVYTTGAFQFTVDLNPGSGNFNVTAVSNSSWDVFVQKLDAAGNFVWAEQIGDMFNDRGLAITTDAAENVYTTGFCSNTADFDPGPGVYNIGSVVSIDAFIQKLDAAGNFVWAKSVGGSLGDQGCSINVDGLGNIYLSGSFHGTADFDPGPGMYNLTASPSFNDIFLLKLNALGNLVWAVRFGDTIEDIGYSSMSVVSGSVYASGFFGHTVDFDPGPGIWNLTAGAVNDVDVFVIKLNEIQVLPVELISFTAVPVDNSKVKLNWATATEINNDYFTVERSIDATNWENVIQVDGNGNTNYTINYEAWDLTPYSGISYYRLKQTDFDGQFFYSNVVAVNLGAINTLILLPNPVTNELVIWCPDFGDQAEIIIYNALGETVYSKHPSSDIGRLSINATNFPSGAYLVKLKTSAGITIAKFVKQQ